jgi:F-type H+-transporting ATPase subunit delta
MANGLNGGASRRALARVVAGRLSADGADGKRVMLELAAYLVQNRQVEDADLIINDVADELYLQSGRLVVEVTCAHPLTDDARQRLTGYLQSETGAKSVELHEMVDESLIGGLIAKTPSAELDVSVRNTLRQLTGLAGPA